MKKIVRRIVASVVAVAILFVALTSGAIQVMAAGNGLTLSPMNEKIIINPGESYQSSFKLSNPANSTKPIEYELSVEPFYLSSAGNAVFEEEDIEKEYTQMVDWVEFDVPTKGKLEPNQVEEILFTITVPKSAAAGGQYAMIAATVLNGDSDGGGSQGGSSSTSINEVKRMGHLIYAEITGNVVKTGEVVDINVPSFLLSGNVSGTATVKNTGNVHGDAKFTMQVFPLFSSEEVYTNEESPAGATILPNRDYYAEIVWDKTPEIGIFNVVFKAEFAGESKEVSKMVIKAPMWLLFIIFFVIALIIIWIVTRVRRRGKRSVNTNSSASAEQRVE